MSDCEGEERLEHSTLGVEGNEEEEEDEGLGEVRVWWVGRRKT